jgi:CRISPR-associated protein Cmr2
MSPKYVLFFSLGPVQSFIVEARRTQDLWAGSKMLVELSRVAVLAGGGQLIYPAPEALSNLKAGVPNKFVTIVDDPASAARSARQAAVEKWRDFADAALRTLPDNEDPELQAIWQRQRDHHLEFYWAAAPLPGGYIHAYGKASEALDARKRTRDFEQIEEDGLKDSLSGMRSALRTSRGPGKTLEARALSYWKQIWERKQTRAALKEGERLDTIGAMKRFALDRGFPSVSTVASAPFVRACGETGLLDILRQAIQSFNRQMGYEFFYRVGDWGRGFEYDGDLLYEETYARGRLKASYGSADPAQVVLALRELYRETKDRDIRPVRLTPYYAVLAMDGDRMGKHIGACRSHDEHTELSRRLAAFADKVKMIVDKHAGYLVYAGGDDVLAFFPLESVLKGARAVVEKYQEQFADWQQHGPDGTSLPFTVSAGMAIAHHLHPLDAVLQEARRAEKNAKNLYRRDALCVSVLKRSGESIHVGSKWQSEGGGIITLIQNVVGDLQEERLASRFVYELYDQVTALGSVESDIVEALLKRLLKRHRTKEDRTPNTGLGDLMSWVSLFMDEKIRVDGGAVAELSRWLLLAQFIAQGGSK